VKSVEARGKGAKIVTEESYRKVSRTLTHTCTKNSLTIDPSSFLWAGEPGGGLRMELESVKRKGISYPGGRAFKRGATAAEEFKAKAKRLAAEGTKAKIREGEVEMERELTVGRAEPVLQLQDNIKAVRVEVALSGRGRLGADAKTEREMPAGAKAVFFFAPNVGLVKVTNRFNEAWLLKR